MKTRYMEIHEPKDGSLPRMFCYVIGEEQVGPFFTTKTVCEAYIKRYDELSDELSAAKRKADEYAENGCSRGLTFYTECYIPSIKDKIEGFFQDVNSGVFEKRILKQI